ncbi:DUF5789 family protein [Halorarum halobium]|uniref:DUF5789 family protein n=1 Tax=Halorarum halobium TaxID=3075121 RepID=UPI0028A78A8B|nr:hypothetical protein [Halobaculum sp. XH14]
MAREDTDREEGVDFVDVNAALEELSYPVSADELIDEHGDREFRRTNAGPITVAELFGPMGEDTFESTREVRQMALNHMPSESVGRQRYSDRGVSNDTREGVGESENESF